MESEQAQNEMQVPLSKYSKRVILKNIVGRGDDGVGLVGQKVVIGGWVKSSREIKKDLPPPVQQPPKVDPEVVGPKDVSCVEVLQSRIPFFKSFFKVLGGGDHRIRDKLDSVIPKQPAPQPTTSILQISDGSCVPSLQVILFMIRM